MTVTEPQSNSLDQLLSDLRQIANYDEAHHQQQPTEVDVTGCGRDFLLHYPVAGVKTSLLLPEADAREFVRGSNEENAPYTHLQLHTTLKRWLAQVDARDPGDR